MVGAIPLPLGPGLQFGFTPRCEMEVNWLVSLVAGDLAPS